MGLYQSQNPRLPAWLTQRINDEDLNFSRQRAPKRRWWWYERRKSQNSDEWTIKQRKWRGNMWKSQDSYQWRWQTLLLVACSLLTWTESHKHHNALEWCSINCLPASSSPPGADMLRVKEISVSLWGDDGVDDTSLCSTVHKKKRKVG